MYWSDLPCHSLLIDIDLKKEDVKSFKTVLNYSTDSIQIIGKGRAEDLMIKKLRE